MCGIMHFACKSRSDLQLWVMMDNRRKYKMTIVPMGKRVLLQKDEAVEKTASGLLLAASAKEESTTATVVALGPEVPEGIKLGDRVIYSKFAGESFDVDGKDCLLVEAKDILAIVK